MAVAVIADTFDGAFARLFRRTLEQRSFGAELDSLADAAAFGAVPAVCLAALIPPSASPVVESAWWLAAIAYAACAITRLGFFNLHDTGDSFVGLPVPVAALIVASALLFHPGWLASLVVFAACAAAMVAPVRVPRPSGAGLAVFASWPATLVVLHVAALVD
jgi:CDP-diacylglycerol--serine O-phosphatidyltransferase